MAAARKRRAGRRDKLMEKGCKTGTKRKIEEWFYIHLPPCVFTSVRFIWPFLFLSTGMHAGTRQEEVIDHRLTDREWAEEWKHLDHVRKVITFLLLFSVVLSL